MTQIGDRLYTNPHGRPEQIGKEHGEITGETKFSWLVGDPKFKRDKVNKTTMREAVAGYGSRRWYTVEGLHDECWIKAYRHVISGCVQASRDVKKLKLIAAILEMKVES